jgi:hypothetical protein
MDRFPISGNAIVAYIFSVITTVKGVVSDMDVVTVIGISIGVVTLGVNWFYKHQQHRRDEIRLKMQQDDDACADQ